MESPFWQNLREAIGRLSGRSLVVVGIIWVALLVLGGVCAVGGGSLFMPQEGATTAPETVAPTTALPVIQPTASLPGEVITLPTPTSQATEGGVELLPPLPWGRFGYGIAIQGVIPVMGDYNYTVRQVKDHLGLEWVKQQLRWTNVHPDPTSPADWSLYDPVVETANAMGLKVMLSIVDAPHWTRSYLPPNVKAAPPDDLALYAAFMGEIVDRYKGRIHAIEVWNEQNLNREWDTAEGLNPERYVEMLRLAYQAIKSRDPNIIVISGALSPTGVTMADPANPNRLLYMDDYLYLERMIAAGFLDYTDCVGAHHNGINMPPNVTWNEGFNDPTASFRGPFDNPHHSWSFKSTIWDYYTMVQRAGYNKPLCLTEFGWASAEGWTEAPEGFQNPKKTTTVR